MQQETPESLHASPDDDLESLAGARYSVEVDEAPDLVAPMAHAGREGELEEEEEEEEEEKLPLTPLPLPARPSSTFTSASTTTITTVGVTVTATATATATATSAAAIATTESPPTASFVPTQQPPPLTQHQYVVPQVDRQHSFQVSQIVTSPTTQLTLKPLTYSEWDSPASENARLTGPFSPVFPLYDSESDENIHTPIDQTRHSTTVITTLPLSAQIPSRSRSILTLPSAKVEFDSVATETPRQKSNMFFGDLQKSSAAAHRRRSMATTSALTDYEADLTSKDRMKQKEAIRRVLAEKIREDWHWTWPRQVGEPGTPTVNRSRESLADEDWREREEWISNVSESEGEIGATIGTPTITDVSNDKDPFRFDSPDGVGDTLRRTAEDRKARRRRRLEEEMDINDGLRCFTHRRNAWTNARHVRRGPRASSTNATPLKRTLSRPTSKPSPTVLTPPPPLTQTQEADFPELITEIRVPPPILPPETPMRKGINERAYATIYDKVVLQSQTPFCPINLSVITQSCVEGWKRDGEWPPKPGEMESVLASVKKASLVGADGPDSLGGVVKSKSVLRRSLRRVMGAVRERAGSKVKEGDEGVLRE